MKEKPKSKLTKITMARLYNLGHYEHVRFELSAEVPKGGSAKQTFLDLGAILARLRPIEKPYNYERAKEALKKLPEELNEVEKGWAKEFSEYNAAKALRLEAIEKLDALGGSIKRGGGMDKDEDLPF